MKKLLFSLMIVYTGTITHAQKISDFPTILLLQKDSYFIDSVTRAFVDAQKLDQEKEADLIIHTFATKSEAVRDYQVFLDRVITDEIDVFCFGVNYPAGFNRLSNIYASIATSHGRTYAENGLKLKLLYSISRDMNSFFGADAIIGKNKFSEKLFREIADENALNEQQAKILLLRINAAYTECLAALDLQRMPDADRITIKKALWDITPHITNL